LRPIHRGDRGAAVEDVQRRLIVLGADLGPTGVDGVFLGATLSAVQAFQRERGLNEDGEVGPLTWAALVDATFTLGDRLLYLRHPYLHGEDVRALQCALNSLGFACGENDGIFGAFTERALRDFQMNTAIAVDGIAGPNTVRAVESLRHVWSSKCSPPPAELRAGPARRAAVLKEHDVTVVAPSEWAEIVERVVNVARAAEPAARIRHTFGDREPSPGLVVELSADARTGVSAVIADQTGEAFARRLSAAVVSALDNGTGRVDVVLAQQPEGEYDEQSFAVSVLDGLCMGLGSHFGPVVP
jgi:peptidoglycan hydrolase-like protein with peptidoglycan-binding domain